MVVVACGGGDDADPTTTAGSATPTTAAPGTTAAPTTAAPTTAAPTTTAPTTTAGGTEPTVPGGAVELTISAVDNESFSTTALEAPAGAEVTVTFKNDDTSSGEPHNWHVVAGDDEYSTPIKAGPSTDSVTFTIDVPGEYEYFCDTHLTAMKGTLTVTP
jgi:plastocyanin